MIIFAALDFGSAMLVDRDAILATYRPGHVTTGSMSPEIATNAYIITKKINGEDVKVDDVIVYNIQEEGKMKLITHRVIEVHEETKTVSTKGDANSVVDTFDKNLYPDGLPMGNIVAEVDYVFNWAAPIHTAIFATPRTPFLLIGIIVGFVLFWKAIKDMLYDKEYDPGYIKMKKEESRESNSEDITNP